MVRTGRASGLAVTLRGTALVILASVMGVPPCSAKPPVQARQAWAIPTPYFAGPILEDVSRGGMLLLNELGGYVAPHSWNIPNPMLVLRTSGPGRQVDIPLPSWPKYQYELPQGIAEIPSGPFKFVDAGEGIVGVQGPWLVLIDVRSRKVIRRVQALANAGDLEQRKAAIPVLKSPAPGKLVNTGKAEAVAQPPFPPIVAVSVPGNRLAVTYNGPAKHWVFVYTSDLTRRVAGWEVSKPVQDICWSESGKSLAVLYRTTWNPHAALASIPNVSIFDTASWKELLAFATGGYDARIAFNHDGAQLYAISGWYGTTGHAFGLQTEGNIRAFSTATGRLERTLKAGRTGVRGNLVVSPDGRLIAAESTTYPLRPPWKFDAATIDVDAGFVILDVATGRLLYREKRRTQECPFLPLFFSPDGRELIVNFPIFGGGDAGGHIVGYSLANLYR